MDPWQGILVHLVLVLILFLVSSCLTCCSLLIICEQIQGVKNDVLGEQDGVEMLEDLCRVSVSGDFG